MAEVPGGQKEGGNQAEQRGRPELGPLSPGSVSLTHQSCSINVSEVAWVQARTSCGEGGIVWLEEQRGKNAELPKSCEQVVSSGWVPRGFATVLPV